MNTDKRTGFENGQPVLIQEFDYALLDQDTGSSSSEVELAITRIHADLVQKMAMGQVNFLLWMLSRTPTCSLSEERQTRAKCAIALYDIRPSALMLEGKPTLTGLGERLEIPKQKISELYQDYKSEIRVQFLGVSPEQRRPAVRRRKAKAASDCGERITTYQAEIEFGPTPKHPYGG